MRPDDPRHGTYAGYTEHYRLGEPICHACREAKRAYGRRLSKETNLGRSRFAEPTLLRRHILALKRQGMTRSEIARAGGSTVETIRRIELGLIDRVRLNTFQRLAVVTPQESDVFMPRLGAARRIQALAAIGYPLRWVADSLGMKPQALANVIHEYRPNGGRVYRTTWEAVADLYDRHHMTPGPSKRTRGIARKHGWLPPLAWDDIDDPNERPVLRDRPRSKTELDEAVVLRVIAGERLHMTRAERLEVVRRLVKNGWSEERIEAHTGIAKALNKSRYPIDEKEAAA